MAKKLNYPRILEAGDKAENLAVLLTKDQLDAIGHDLVEKYARAKTSRKRWEERTAQSMNLALQVVEKKTFPWENASNIKFPLVTIAAVQFSSRAYPALIESTEPVKCRVFGEDATGERANRARRIAKHLSWQVLEEDEDWEDGMDRLLVTLPIVGCDFKKTYFDALKGHNVSEHVLASDLVVDYYTKSLDTCRFIAHRLIKHNNDLEEKMRSGAYRRLKLESHNPEENDEAINARREAQGTTEPELTGEQHSILEIHCWLDLDKDKYEEPYIVTIHKDSRQVLRISPRIEDTQFAPDGTVVRIKPKTYFTKYELIPSPDGGFYGLGMGALLGPLNESVNTIINQLVDAGTLHNLQGGFIGKGVRIKGGKQAFRPGEWRTVLSTGDDLRKNLVPLPTREPSSVLFSLLGLLVQYGERMSATTDAMMGENPGQNQAATTTMAVIEQGMKVYTGIFKRIYRSMTEEYRKLFRLNREFLDPMVYFRQIHEAKDNTVLRSDYQEVTDKAIAPSADPNVVSDAQRLIQAEALANRALQVPGYNKYEVEKRYLKALRVPGIDIVYPNPEGPNAIKPDSDPKIVLETAKLELEKEKLHLQRTVEILKHHVAAAEAEAKVAKLQTAAVLDMAKAEDLDNAGNIDDISAKIEAIKAAAEIEEEDEASRESDTGTGAGVEEQPTDGADIQGPAQ